MGDVRKYRSRAKAWPKVGRQLDAKPRSNLFEGDEWIDKARWIHYQGKAGTLPTRVTNV